jgi:drug/metabolite transporter (DMT)-like permease
LIANPAVPIALFASLFFGLGLVLTQYGLRHVSSATGAAISVPTTMLLCWLAAPWLLDTGAFNLQAVALFAAVGVIYPGVVTLLTFEGSRRMGPTVTGTVGSTAPFFAIIAAVLFLGERPTLLVAAAVAAIIGGVVLLTWQPASDPRQWPRRALWLPIGGAILRGVAQAVTKLGLLLWPSPFAAGFIGYTLSTAVVSSSAHLREGPAHRRLNRKGVAWFMLVGVVNGTATFSLYAALNQGNVSVVAPLVATYPLFTLLLGAFLLHNERITLPRLTGVAFTVLGVILLLVR